jgi:hypothetical protein
VEEGARVVELFGRRPFRRRRRWQGATWTPESQSADRVDGVWCPVHRKRHGYGTLGFEYERTSKGGWQVLWSCKTTGNVLQVMPLGQKSDEA